MNSFFFNNKNEIDELKIENQTLKKENQTLKKENQTLKKENQTLKKENQTLKKENENLNNELDNIDDELEYYENVIKNKNEENKTLNIKYKKNIKEMKLLNEKLNSSFKDLNFFKEELQKNSKELELIQNEFKKIGFQYETIENLKNMKFKKCNIQRNINNEHYIKLKEDIEKEPLFITPLYITNLNGIYEIIDGQHRFEVINKSDVLDQNLKIPIKIFDINNPEDKKKLFLIINNNLKLEDFEKMLALGEDELNKILKCASRALRIKFSEYIKNGNCRRPNISIKDLEINLYNIIKKENKFNNNIELEEFIIKLNEQRAEFLKDKDNTYKPGLFTIRTKKTIKFYLGLYKDWTEFLY
jgi:chromosome segregation ATPase